MHYFIDAANNVFAFDRAEYAPPDLTEIEEAEALAIASASPPPAPAEIWATNTSMRDVLLTAATLAIAPLQAAIDLDIATDADTALLKKWKRYLVDVNRVDLTQVAPGWPVSPVDQ